MTTEHPIMLAARKYPQLRLAVRKDMSKSEIYRDVVLCGEPCMDRPDFSFSDEDTLSIVNTPAGEAEILYLNHREDFVHAYRALAYRCEPVEIPDSVGAIAIRGLINWEKINRHHEEYLASGGEDWNGEFREFTSEKSNYLGEIILLSSGYYSNVSPEKVGLPAQEWKEKSLTIRKYHELTHFICRKVYPNDIEPIRDEVIADMIGLLQAFGEYDTQLAKIFLGIEGETYRAGGRLAHYAKDDLDSAIAKAGNDISTCAELVRDKKTENVFDLIPEIFKTE